MTNQQSLTDIERKVIAAQKRRARDLPNEFLDCRSLGHAWREVMPDRSPEFGDIHCYQCMRCKSIRDDIVAPKYGELLGRGYRHAPGYLQKRPDDGSRPFSAAALRAERARRFKERAQELGQIEPLYADAG